MFSAQLPRYQRNIFGFGVELVLTFFPVSLQGINRAGALPLPELFRSASAPPTTAVSRFVDCCTLYMYARELLLEYARELLLEYARELLLEYARELLLEYARELILEYARELPVYCCSNYPLV